MLFNQVIDPAKDGPDTLYLSGMFAGGWCWESVHWSINSRRQCVLKPALCALGQDADEIVDSLIPEIAKLGKQFVVVGNSLGCYVGAKLAIKAPELVQQLVISGAAGFVHIEQPIKVSRHNLDEFADSLGEAVYFDAGKVSEQDFQRVVEILKDNAINVIRLMKYANDHLDSPDLFNQVRVPVHAIWGKQDTVTPLEDAVDTLTGINASLQVIDQCGHSPMVECPGEFAKALNAALKMNDLGSAQGLAASSSF